MLTIGHDEIESASKLGKTIVCEMCGKRHKILYADKVLSDGSSVPSMLLAFYKCGKEEYFAGINGKDLRRR